MEKIVPGIGLRAKSAALVINAALSALHAVLLLPSSRERANDASGTASNSVTA